MGIQASATEPVVTALTGGNAVVVWTDDRQDGDGDGIYARFISNTGVFGGVEFRLNTTTLGFQNQPVVTALPTGGFIVVWTDASQTAPDTSIQSIRARLFDASGTALSYNGSVNDFVVNSTTLSNQQQPAVTILTNGSFVITWTDSSGADSGSAPDIRGRIFNSTGPIGNDFIIPTTTGGVQDSSTVAALSNGNFIVAWTDGASSGNPTPLRARIFTSSGTALGPDFVVNTFSQTNNNYDVAIAALADGRFVIAWTDTSGTLGDAAGSAVHGRIYLDNGTPNGTEFLINQAATAGDQYGVSLTADGTNFYADWTDGAVGATGIDGSGTSVRSAIMLPTVYKAGNGGETWVGTSLADTITGGTGNDTITGDPGAMPTENSAAITRLYLAALGRGPDAGGLANWTALLDAGTSLTTIANGFVTSTEFVTTYGSLDNTAFVTLL